jgi:PRTRC genetic system protein B
MDETMPPTPAQTPRLRLDFFETAVILSRWEANGQTTSYPVAVQDVVSACTGVTLSSGFLPPDTLFWRRQANQTTLGITVPGRRWQVRTDKKTYHVPMPPLVFVGRGHAYSLYAVKQKPLTIHTPLYHVPCPNVFADGGICPGATPFPACSAQSMNKALTLFWEGSLFNGHLSQGKCCSQPKDVRKLWVELDGRKRFPLAELVPMNKTLQSLI